MAFPRSTFVVLLASAVASACGSSDSRKRVPVDGGGDGATLNDSSTPGKGSPDARVTPDGGAPASDASVDASTGSPDGSITADGSLPTDAGTHAETSTKVDSGPPVLGEFCAFADPELEDLVRRELENDEITVPAGPIPVALASLLTTLDPFCDCNRPFDFMGAECLQGLETLVLRQDYLHLERLRYLPALRTVQVDYASALPPGLTALKQIENLELASNITDLSGLEQLTGLKELSLGNNTDLSDIAPLAALVNLTDLYLQLTQVANIAPLAGLTQLENLALDYTLVTNLAPLQGLTSLENLGLFGNPITNLAPLVANTGLGSGDTISLSLSDTNCASFKADAATLANRGVTLTGVPTCP